MASVERGHVPEFMFCAEKPIIEWKVLRTCRHLCAEGHWVPQSLTFTVVRARHEYCVPLSQ